jgi:hypothetical protein
MTMTTQHSRQLTVDLGAIYELAFTNRWNKPAAVYKLTPAMAEVADYKDRTFHAVVIRETGEILSTREFKRTFRDKFPKKKNILLKTGGVHKYTMSSGSVTNGTYKNQYFAIKYYMYQLVTGNIKLVMHLITDKESEVILNTEMGYTAETWTLLESHLAWFTTLRHVELLHLHINN